MYGRHLFLVWQKFIDDLNSRAAPVSVGKGSPGRSIGSSGAVERWGLQLERILESNRLTFEEQTHRIYPATCITCIVLHCHYIIGVMESLRTVIRRLWSYCRGVILLWLDYVLLWVSFRITFSNDTEVSAASWRKARTVIWGPFIQTPSRLDEWDLRNWDHRQVYRRDGTCIHGWQWRRPHCIFIYAF